MIVSEHQQHQQQFKCRRLVFAFPTCIGSSLLCKARLKLAWQRELTLLAGETLVDGGEIDGTASHEAVMEVRSRIRRKDSNFLPVAKPNLISSGAGALSPRHRPPVHATNENRHFATEGRLLPPCVQPMT
jgi:predicted membrane metal-binding protein